MVEKINPPQVRFSGFKTQWVNHEFGNIISEYCEKTISENEDTLLSCAIEGMFLNSELFSHQRGMSNIGYLKIKKGDLILSAQNLHLGNANVNLRFQHGIISPAYKVYNIVGCDAEFLYVWIKRDATKSFFLNATTAGASLCRKNIEWDTLYRQSIFLPEATEQEKIAKFLIELEQLISNKTLQKKKIEIFKATMLEKMFPQGDADIPEIRFKDFTDGWERHKLDECFSERTDTMPDGELLSVTIGGGVKRFSELGRRDNSNEDKSKYKKVCVGDIAYNSMRMWQGASGCSPYDGIVSPAYTVLVPKSGIDSQCIAYLFKVPEMMRVFRTNSQGITSDNWNLKFSKLKEIEIMIPKNIEEQRRIASFLRCFDASINLYQQQLIKLQSLKKALLEKMFV